MKKFVLALLAVVLVLGLSSVAFAAHTCDGTEMVVTYVTATAEYDKVSKVPCETNYYEKVTCADCDYVYSTGAWTNKTHVSEGVVYAEATDCAQTYELCENCGVKINKNTLTGDAAYAAHSWENKVTAPVCGATGKMWKECTVCRAKTDMVETEVKGHNVINYKKVFPTCTTDGEITYDCADCGAHVVITKATPGYATELTKTGHSKGSFNAHGLNVTNKAGYQWRYQDYKVPTCTEDGHVIFTCDHIDPNTGKVCDYSKTEFFAKIDHKKADGTSAWVYGGPVPGSEKTCTADGLAYYTCSINGCQKVDVDKTKGHAFKAWEVRVEATCTLDGLKYRECTVCKDPRNGKYFEETEVIPKLGHDIANEKVLKEANCTEAGTKFGACKRCLETITTTIDPLGHKMGEWKVEATYRTRACTVAGCKYFEVEAIAPVVPETPADPEDKPTTGGNENTGNGGSSSTGSGSDASIPATGDNTSNVPYIMMVAAVAGLVVLVASKRKVNC